MPGAQKLKTYFDSVAEFILYVYDVYQIVSQPGKINLPLSKLQEINHNLYADILPEHYELSFANPDYAVEKLGEYGKYLCMLYAEIRAMIAYAYEDEMPGDGFPNGAFLRGVWNLYRIRG